MELMLNFEDNSRHAVTFGIPHTYDGQKKISVTVHFIREKIVKTPEKLKAKSLKKLRFWLRVMAKGYRHRGSRILKREIEIAPASPGNHIWKAIFTYK